MRPTKIHFLFALASLLFVVAPITARAGPIIVDETSLGSSGKPYQANLAPDGRLLVSIDVANQIWHIDPNTGAYSIYKPQYPDRSNLSDAHADAAGNIWFADWTLKKLGRIANGSLTLWDLPFGYPWGVAIDSGGRVWVSDTAYGTLYRFKPDPGATTGTLTCYGLPSGGISTYVLAEGNNLWLGDAWNGRILRMPLDAGDPPQVTAWEIPGAEPEGMALDSGGRLWWADTGLNRLARLSPDDPGDPIYDPVTFYTPPVAGSNPLVIQVSGDRVWYSDDGSRTIGVLDPGLAGGVTISATTSTPPLAPIPACGGVVTGKQGDLQMTSGLFLSWSPTIWASAAEGNGWGVYRLPAGGKPYGLAMAGDSPWVVDQGRRKLAHASGTPIHSIYLPLTVRS